MTEIEKLLSDSLTALLLQFEQQTTTVRDLADRIERLEILISPALRSSGNWPSRPPKDF
jgi:hypothetical protein